jgi:DNA-directed RNA polymerase subunit H (RpoH/RPB5)
MSVSVEYNNREINQTVIENILKMLERRNIINSWESEIKKFNIEDFQNKSTFELEKLKIGIYLVNAKLTSIVQGHPLDVYLSNNLDIHKIIIAKDVAKKVVKQIVNDYKNAEFFFESEMLEDIPSKIFIPKHEIIVGEEREEILNKFTEAELARLFLTDMMARYYGAKIGDIFKITRPSFTAGKNIFYRRVVNSSWDILFEK